MLKRRNNHGTFIQIDIEPRKFIMRLTAEEREIILKLREHKSRDDMVGRLRRVLHV